MSFYVLFFISSQSFQILVGYLLLHSISLFFCTGFHFHFPLNCILLTFFAWNFRVVEGEEGGFSNATVREKVALKSSHILISRYLLKALNREINIFLNCRVLTNRHPEVLHQGQLF